MADVLAVPVRPFRAGWRPDLRRVPWGVAGALVGVVLGRLLYLHVRTFGDAAGYLMVGRQWHAGGSSLYGNYWVDRPPLLVTIFGVAAHLGGVLPLRLIGIGATVVTVAGVAWAAHLLGGSRAASCCAVTAAGLLVSPLNAAQEVNGELLAAPFVAVGLALVISSLRGRTARTALLAGAGAGACAVAAVLIKQNMIDVVVFAVAMVVFTVRPFGIRRTMRWVAGFVAGAVVAVAAAAMWTLWHGTSLRGVWFAMYPFRWEFGRAQLAAGLRPAELARRNWTVEVVLLNGMALAALVIVCTVISRHRDDQHGQATGNREAEGILRRWVPAALVVLLVYDTASVCAGRHFFPRYVLQLVVPLSLGIGLVAGRHLRLGRVVAAFAAASAMLVTVTGTYPASSNDIQAGRAIAAAARPGDTIVGMDGHALITYASGLSDPYPYLWATPELVLDRHARLLSATLLGARAPTWFVAPTSAVRHGPPTLRQAVATGYQQVAAFDHQQIYLRDGVDRAVPTIARRQAMTHSSPRRHDRR